MASVVDIIFATLSMSSISIRSSMLFEGRSKSKNTLVLESWPLSRVAILKCYHSNRRSSITLRRTNRHYASPCERSEEGLTLRAKRRASPCKRSAGPHPASEAPGVTLQAKRRAPPCKRSAERHPASEAPGVTLQAKRRASPCERSAGRHPASEAPSVTLRAKRGGSIE